MTSETGDGDTFLDCLSDDDDEEAKVAPLQLTMGHGDKVVCKQAPRYYDPMEMRAVLEQAAVSSLKSRSCDCFP